MVQRDKPQMTTQFGTQEMRIACRITKTRIQTHTHNTQYRGADKSLARPGRKQATATKL